MFSIVWVQCTWDPPRRAPVDHFWLFLEPAISTCRACSRIPAFFLTLKLRLHTRRCPPPIFVFTLNNQGPVLMFRACLRPVLLLVAAKMVASRHTLKGDMYD